MKIKIWFRHISLSWSIIQNDSTTKGKIDIFWNLFPTFEQNFYTITNPLYLHSSPETIVYMSISAFSICIWFDNKDIVFSVDFPAISVKFQKLWNFSFKFYRLLTTHSNRFSRYCINLNHWTRENSNFIFYAN